MTYGTYSFSPVPMVNIAKVYHKTEDGTQIGTTFNMDLNGVLTPLPTGTAGITETMHYMDVLRHAFATDGCPFVISCNDDVLWSGNPRVNDISFEENGNNWVNTIDYTVSLSFDTEDSEEDDSLAPPHIENASETWSVEFADGINRFSIDLPTAGVDASPYVLNMSHTISAKGKKHFISCNTTDKEPWEYARQYVITKLSTGADSAFNTQLEGSGVINLRYDLYSSYNHMRVQNTDKLGGSYSVTENWLVMNTGLGIPGNSLEDFTINVDKRHDSAFTTVTVDGTIRGVETRSYGSDPRDFTTTETKYDAASGYWNTVKDRIFYRAQLIHRDQNAGEINVLSLNTDTVSERVGHSPSQGVITYSYTYNNRPSNCITGALTENISIVDNNPADVFASVMVLGRANGPVLQNLNTQTVASREISIELLCRPSTACTAVDLRVPSHFVQDDVRHLLCEFQNDLTDNYDQVFKTADSESWNPKTGQYSRRVGYTYQSCTAMSGTTVC